MIPALTSRHVVFGPSTDEMLGGPGAARAQPRWRAGGPVAKFVARRRIGADAIDVGAHLGYEWGYGVWTITELGVEATSSDMVIVPSLSLEVPNAIPIFFGVEVGAGVPIRVLPSPDVGARLQWEAHLGPVGGGGALDLWPGVGPARREATVSIFARISL